MEVGGRGEGGEGVVLGSIFAGYVPLASQSPRGNVHFAIPNSHFLFIKLLIYVLNRFNYGIINWIDTFVTEHVLYSHFCTANRPIFFNTETPYLPEYSCSQIPKICDPILVTLLKMHPHDSQSSRENATQSSGTAPLACY